MFDTAWKASLAGAQITEVITRGYSGAPSSIGDYLMEATGNHSLSSLNVIGTIAGTLLHIGFRALADRGRAISARALGLTAHVVEELKQSNRWRHATESNVRHTGPSPRPLDILLGRSR